SVPRALADPIHLPVGDLAQRAEHRVGTDDALAQVGVDADDVGLSSGEAEQLAPAPTDEERRMRLLHRRGLRVVARDSVVLALEAEGTVGKAALHDRDRLLEACDSCAGGVVLQSELLVVGELPARAEAELEPAV